MCDLIDVCLILYFAGSSEGSPRKEATDFIEIEEFKDAHVVAFGEGNTAEDLLQ
jgi:hypothetical protein